MGLPTVVRYPDGTTEQFEYDSEGNLPRYVNPTGEETRYAYDGKGLPIERIDAAGFRLAYQNDALRRLSRLTNQNGELAMIRKEGGRLTINILKIQDRTAGTMNIRMRKAISV